MEKDCRNTQMFRDRRVRTSAMLIPIILFYIGGCRSPKTDDYDMAVSLYETLKQIRVPTHSFDYLAHCIPMLLESFGIEVVPILVADVLTAQDEGYLPFEESIEREICAIESLLRGCYAPVSTRQIYPGVRSVEEAVVKMKERLRSWFGPLLGLVPVSKQEEKTIKKLIVRLEKEEIVPEGVGADEIWIGGKLVSSLARFHPSEVERTIERRKKKESVFHPLVLFEGKALLYLLEIIENKPYPLKEILVANAILLRYGATESAYFCLKSYRPGVLPPKWAVEYDKYWFSKLFYAFRQTKE